MGARQGELSCDLQAHDLNFECQVYRKIEGSGATTFLPILPFLRDHSFHHQALHRGMYLPLSHCFLF